MYEAANDELQRERRDAPMSPKTVWRNWTVPFAAISAVTTASTISRRYRFLFQTKPRWEPKARMSVII